MLHFLFYAKLKLLMEWVHIRKRSLVVVGSPKPEDVIVIKFILLKGKLLMNSKRLKLREKIFYGLGDFGGNFCWAFISGFALIYFTNTLGLNAGIIGTIMLVSRLMDVVTDVAIGGFIDKTQTKWGKAKPWFFWTIIPCAIATFMLFSVPRNASEIIQYIWIFVIYSLIGAGFYAANNISYAAFTSLITANKEDRVSMGTFRFFFALLAALFINTFTMKFVGAFGGGDTGWRWVALLYGVILVATMLFTALGIKELTPEELGVEGKVDSNDSKIPLFTRIKYLVLNKYFLMIFGIYLANYFAGGYMSGIGIYFCKYVLKNEALLGLIGLVQMVPVVIGLSFTPVLTKKCGIRKVCMVGAFISILATIWNLVLGGGNFVFLLFGLAVAGLASAPLIGSLNALISETALYGFRKFNVRIEGTIFSCSSVGYKVGTGIGSAFSGWMLAFIGFNGLAAAQTQSVLSTIKTTYIGLPLLTSLAVFVILFFLNVEEVNKKAEIHELTESSIL